MRTIIEGLRNASASDQAQGAAHTILEIEEANGGKLVVIDDDPFLFTGYGKRLLAMNHNDARWSAHMAMVYGLNTKDRELTPKITSLLGAHILWNGTKMQPRRWTAYLDGALHLSRYDGTTYRLTGEGVSEGPNNFLVDDGWSRANRGQVSNPPLTFEIADNGTHVLFADDDSGSVPADPIIGRNGRLFKLLQGVNWSRSTAGGMKPKHQAQVLMIWMLAVAFSDLFPTKPILIAEGAPGSGKSTLMQMIQQALFGSIEPFVVSEDGERDFWVGLLRSPITILDNTDDLIKWLPNTINAYVTRGYRTERKLHTNTGRVELRPHSFIAVASKDPKSFRAEDTADRSLMLRLESRFQRGGPGGDSIQMLTANIARERALLWGEWLYYLNRVCAAVVREPVRRTTARLGDFEVFAYAACRALGWQSERIVPDLMEAHSRERTAFACEADIVLDVLHDWMAMPSSPGREITARDLFKELSNHANLNNKPFVRTPQALAQRLRAPHIQRTFEVIDSMKGDRKIYQLFKAENPLEGN